MKRLSLLRFLPLLTISAACALSAGVGFLGAAEPPDIPLGDPSRPGLAAPIPESVRALGADPGPASGSSAIEYSQVVAAQPLPPTLEMELQVWLVNLAVRHPWLGVLLLLVASARLGLKPLMAAAHRYVESTAGPEDDEALARLESSQAFRWVSFALDVVGSVKLTTVLLLISRFRSRGTADVGRNLAVAGFAALCLLGTPGCASKAAQQLVTTHITYSTNGLDVTSPKEITIDELQLEDPRFGLKAVVRGYSSAASAAALRAAESEQAGWMAQIQMMQTMVSQFGVMAARAYGVPVDLPPTNGAPVAPPALAPPPRPATTNTPAAK